VPQDEYLAAFDSLVRTSKIRELGASNFTAPRLGAALDLAAAQGLTRFTVAQDRWSLVERRIESGLLPTLTERGLVELPYASLAAGFLTGKYRPGQAVDSARAASAGPLPPPARKRRHPERPGRGSGRAHDIGHGGRPRVAAGAPTVGAPIASARTPEQVATLLASADLQLSPEELDRLTNASASFAA
jgi:aryl-alcohol dehydrogenase-like predicted oxidoreductase